MQHLAYGTKHTAFLLLAGTSILAFEGRVICQFSLKQFVHQNKKVILLPTSYKLKTLALKIYMPIKWIKSW